MTNLTNFQVTDNVTQMLAAQYNLLLGSIVQGNFANIETLSADKTLIDDDFAYQVLDCNGANRIVNLSAIASTNHPFYVLNSTTSAYYISVKNSAGTLLAVVYSGDGKLFLSDGVSYRLFRVRTINGFRGQANNYVITPTVASNNLTVALKTVAGNDPSPGDPVEIRIGNQNITITSALSVTANAATNWCNAGSAELATKLIDYFVYLGYNATDGVTIGFSRIPWGKQYSTFSATSTNEQFCKISNITTAAAGDAYENIGRFSATLSAGAGYTWTVPTFTASNLINRPIYETNTLTWTPAITYSGGTTSPTSNTVNTALYRITNGVFSFIYQSTLVRGAGDRTFTLASLPFTLTGLTPVNCIESVTAAGLHSPTGAYTNGININVKTTMANDGVYYIAGSVTLATGDI